MVLLWVASAGFFGFFARGFVENTDAEITLHAARAWYLRGNPGLVRATDTELLADGSPTWSAEHAIADWISERKLFGRTGVDGKQYVWFPIGHQALLVPCVAIGDWLQRRLPEPERRFHAERGELFGEFFWSRFVASFVSPLAAAGSLVLLALLARRLGASPRDALLATGIATLCTQFWPGSSETMSNAPGTFFLVATTLSFVCYARGPGTARSLFTAGVAAGATALVRYPQVLVIAPFAVWVVAVALRRRRARDLLWLVLGGLPGVALLAASNALRFGSVFETGYTENAGFGSFPVLHGLVGILVAPGKGLLWFAPPIWLVLALSTRRELRTGAWFAAGAGLTALIALFSTVPYWAAGQCWGIRYLTGPLVILLVVTFAIAPPWRVWPRVTVLVAATGLLVSLGGVVTPYTGQQHFAFRAAEAVHGPQENLDNNVNFSLALSPLHSHWTYAWQSMRGRIDSGRSEDTTEALFGIRVDTAPGDRSLRLPNATDSGFRHVWSRSLKHYWPDFPELPVTIVWWFLTILLAVLAIASWLRLPDATAPRR